MRFEITALPLILKKILLPSLDLTIKAWALFKGTKASRTAGLGNHSSRAELGAGKGGRAHSAQETFLGTTHRAASLSRLKCAVYCRVRLGVPPMSPPRAFLRDGCTNHGARCSAITHGARGARRQEGRDHKSQRPWGQQSWLDARSPPVSSTFSHLPRFS